MTTDALGGGRNGLVVIESDGTIEPVDVLKICGDRFTKTAVNVTTTDIAEIYKSDLVRMYQAGDVVLCEKCRRCPIRSACGGGYLPHRYSSKSGFDNPSVYCRDLTKLILHIRAKVVATLPALCGEPEGRGAGAHSPTTRNGEVVGGKIEK